MYVIVDDFKTWVPINVRSLVYGVLDNDTEKGGIQQSIYKQIADDTLRQLLHTVNLATVVGGPP